MSNWPQNGFMSDFGARFLKEIEALGLNQRQVAMRSGIDYPLINKIGKGGQKATLETLVKLLSIPELKPFIVSELTTRSPELFSPETIAVVKRAQGLVDTHGQTGAQELFKRMRAAE